MSTPEATPEDVQEQHTPVVEEPEGLAEDLPAEAPEADATEQRVTPAGAATGDPGVPVEAPEADVAEQRVEVGLDEEDAPIG
jgi:hypothetical protein